MCIGVGQGIALVVEGYGASEPGPATVDSTMNRIHS
jgi:hypothetical protein